MVIRWAGEYYSSGLIMVLFGAHTKETVQRVGYMSTHSGPPLQSQDTFMCIRRSIPWVDTTYGSQLRKETVPLHKLENGSLVIT